MKTKAEMEAIHEELEGKKHLIQYDPAVHAFVDTTGVILHSCAVHDLWLRTAEDGSGEFMIYDPDGGGGVWVHMDGDEVSIELVEIEIIDPDGPRIIR